MPTQHVSQSIVSTTTVIVTAATLANGAFVNSGTAGLIDNRPTTGSIAAGDLVDFFINFGSVVTTGTGTPQVGLALIPSQDGTNYMTPGITAAAAPALQDYKIKTLNTSIALTMLEVQDVPIGPYRNLVLFQNNTGAVIPVGMTIIAVVRSIEIF